MGLYVYQVVKGKKAYLDGVDEVEVGSLRYFTKPYWDVWNLVKDGHSVVSKYGYNYVSRNIAKQYRMFFARQKKAKYYKYVVYEFVEGNPVYEMPEGLTWSYDDPHIGKGKIGNLVWDGEDRAWHVCLDNNL